MSNLLTVADHTAVKPELDTALLTDNSTHLPKSVYIGSFRVAYSPLKGYLSSVWISIEQSVMVSGIVYVFLGLWFMIGHVQLSLLIIGALTTIGCLIFVLILLKIG